MFHLVCAMCVKPKKNAKNGSQTSSGGISKDGQVPSYQAEFHQHNAIQNYEGVNM